MKNLFFLFILLSFTISAQDSFVDIVVKPLQKEQLLFEKVFIHTNKTSYFNDDVIWFNAYVGENSNKPSLRTTLLYVNLLDGEGKLIFSNNVLIHKGVGQGQFELNGIAKTGVVYIQAYTNYMRNFGEDNYFLQKIKITNNSSSQKVISKNNYDIQVFPEGGFLVEGVENTIGIKTLLNGKGTDFSGEIIDSKNNSITSFKEEYLGMLKSSFRYKRNEQYSIIVKLNDTIISKKIPKARKNGVTLKVDNTDSLFVKIKLQTNGSILQPSSKKYRLLFHQRNQLIDFVEITDLNTTLEIAKESFYNGVNTATLFLENQPVSERKFFIEKPSQKTVLKLTKASVNPDSIAYKIQVHDNFQKPLKANLSLSVLPIKTQDFKETGNIKSAFLLSPYLKGNIENPANYFNQKNKKRGEQLDLLLLTQGWTQYSTKKMITDLNPKPSYNFEQGFKLKGTATPLLTNYLGLMTKGNILIDKLYLNGKTDFIFDKLLVYKGDSIKFSFLDNQNNALKPKKISLDTLKLKEYPKLNLQEEYLVKINKASANNDLIEDFDADFTKLDVVDVKGKKRSEKFIERKKFINKYKKEVFDIAFYYQLELDGKYSSSSDLMTFLSREENATIVNWRGLENYLSTGIGEAVLFIDGKRIRSDELNSIYIKMEDIENIGVQQKSPKVRLYQVFTTDNYKNNIQNLFTDFVIQDGYSKAKKYYAPLYDFDTSIKRTEIDWKPELTTNDLGGVNFKIKKSDNLESHLILINGFSENGLLIHEVIRLF